VVVSLLDVRVLGLPLVRRVHLMTWIGRTALGGSCFVFLLFVVCLRLQAALMRMVGKPVKELVKVDLDARLRELGLADHFPISTWPPVAAVRELATKVKQLKRMAPDRANDPFANAELKKYVFLCVLVFLAPPCNSCQVLATVLRGGLDCGSGCACHRRW